MGRKGHPYLVPTKQAATARKIETSKGGVTDPWKVGRAHPHTAKVMSLMKAER